MNFYVIEKVLNIIRLTIHCNNRLKLSHDKRSVLPGVVEDEKRGETDRQSLRCFECYNIEGESKVRYIEIYPVK